jgi:polysaccharide export outer membrane protein
MGVLKRRDRLVVFRVTKDEYRQLQKACAASGARSISDYTRKELLGRSRAAPAANGLEGRLSAFDRRLAELHAAVRQVLRLLKQLAGANGSGSMKQAIISLLLLPALAGLAQAPAVMEEAGKANLPAQVIGVNDLLAISVYRSPELTRTVRVEPSGNITLPLLQEPVRAAGKMPNELETLIASALKREGILVNPVVKVTVAEYASRPISVVGAVKRPLTFQAVGRVTLLDALARAEGLAPEAAQEILVTLPHGGPGGKPLVRRIPVKGLIDAASAELNLLLEGGEEIRVPEAGRVFVVGNVRKPGAYAVPDPKDASVLRLLALAEGLAPYAQKIAYIYREESESGVRREIPIELAKILKREAPDVPLQINDVLYVPDNTGKRATMSVVDRAVGFGAGTISGILIWRR